LEFKVYSSVFVENDVKQKYGLVRSFGLLQATALNMSNMVGIGPFITIPMMISSMGGPQCMLGWAVGTILALCDGLVWSELAAAMPGTGGTYLYLRETFRHTRFGVLLPFLFVWQFIFSGPLEMASGYIGFAQYLSYFWRSMGPWHMRLTAVAVAVTVLALLYRRITAVGIGRPYLWGLAAFGQEGVEVVLRLLRAELVAAMHAGVARALAHAAGLPARSIRSSSMRLMTGSVPMKKSVWCWSSPTLSFMVISRLPGKTSNLVLETTN
jgi:hypothetical protein